MSVPVLAFSSCLWQWALCLQSGLPAAAAGGSECRWPSAPHCPLCWCVCKKLERSWNLCLSQHIWSGGRKNILSFKNIKVILFKLFSLHQVMGTIMTTVLSTPPPNTGTCGFVWCISLCAATASASMMDATFCICIRSEVQAELGKLGQVECGALSSPGLGDSRPQSSWTCELQLWAAEVQTGTAVKQSEECVIIQKRFYWWPNWIALPSTFESEGGCGSTQNKSRRNTEQQW